MNLLPPSFFAPDAVTVARALIGKVVRKDACEGIIVETEAYGTDPASHAYRVTPRSRVMRDTYAHWYVYFTYGMHWCANVTCDKDGVGAVLIRAVEPTKGLEVMYKRRGTNDPCRLTTGPACVTQAFGIGKTENGVPLSEDFGIFAPDPGAPIYGSTRDGGVGVSRRIGITKGVELPWRFFLYGNPYVSRLPKMKIP
jgi:DNA-3-methyladenine glycosylase